MAERRMFAKTIIDSDAFLDMSATAQLLYFHLAMRADDDGFINKPKTIMRMIGAKDDDIRLLIAKKFIIPFETGIVVIKHWKIHNYIRGDRYKETKYKAEKATLIFDENNAYTLGLPTDNQRSTNGLPTVAKMDTQVRLGKDSIKIDNNILCKSTPKKADIDDVFERLWRLYPNKKGKGQVSDSRKKAIYAIGYDEMSRAIKRYTNDLKRDSWRKAQNGSTFFNSGYIDYLDNNYIPAEDERTVENGTDKQDNIYDKLGTVL